MAHLSLPYRGQSILCLKYMNFLDYINIWNLSNNPELRELITKVTFLCDEIEKFSKVKIQKEIELRDIFQQLKLEDEFELADKIVNLEIEINKLIDILLNTLNYPDF